jgi:hypothetical protein
VSLLSGNLERICFFAPDKDRDRFLVNSEIPH